MMAGAEGEKRGTNRLLAKLHEAIGASKYYEAHQFMKTINFRYRTTNKIDELEKLLIVTARTLLDNEQYESGSDVANMVLSLYLDKEIPVRADRINTLTILLDKMQDSPERATFIGNTIEWSGTELEICGIFNTHVVQIYITQQMYPDAWKHLLRLTDAALISKFILQITGQCSIPSGEVDVVIGIFILTLISVKRLLLAESVFLEITSNFEMTPLMNAMRFVLAVCKTPSDPAAFKTIKQVYWPSFNREPHLLRLIHSVGHTIFGIPLPERDSQRSGFVANLFNALSESDSSPTAGTSSGKSSNLDAFTLD